MKRERRRGGIYRIRIVKVMQINKGEGVCVKWEGEVTLLATWPIVTMRGSGDILEMIFGRELNEEREGRIFTI